jgi:hypothetical protein
MKVVICIEQYDVVGILPSQIESLALLNTAMGVTEAAYVDCTPDGFKHPGGFTKYGSWEAFFATETGPFVAFSPDSGDDLRSHTPPADAWLMFSPSMGWGTILDTVTVSWVQIPGGVMNSRDVVPIALWELSTWRVS